MNDLIDSILNTKSPTAYRQIVRKPAETDRSRHSTIQSQSPTPSQPPSRPTIQKIKGPSIWRNRVLLNKNIPILIQTILKHLRPSFILVKKEAFQAKRKQKTQGLVLLMRYKRQQHLSEFFVKGRCYMMKLRRMVRLSKFLSRFSKEKIKNRYLQAFCKILNVNNRKLSRWQVMKEWRSGQVMLLRLKRLFITKMKGYLRQLQRPVRQNNQKIDACRKIIHSLNRYVKVIKAHTVKRLVQTAVLTESKRKNRKTTVRITTPAPQIQQDVQKQKQINKFKLEIEQKQRRIQQLQKDLNDKTRRLSEQQTLVRSNLVNRQQSEAGSSPGQRSNRLSSSQYPSRERSARESPDVNSVGTQSVGQRSHNEKSMKSIRSVFSDAKSMFSVNTMNLIKQLEGDSIKVKGNCCKYRQKYEQQQKRNEHLRHKMELLEEQCQAMAQINRHFDETLQIQLNPKTEGRESVQVSSLKRTNERLQTQLEQKRIELQELRREKEREKIVFKEKLQSIYQKIVKNRK